MVANSKIEWTDATFNPWLGCTKISPACDHCYAERWAQRTGQVEWGGARKRTSISYWRQPLKWNKDAAAGWTPGHETKSTRRPRVFCASLADVFDNQVPDKWRWDLFALIEATPALDWLLLTKRIGNVETDRALPRNVWIGSTVVTQEELHRDLPKLLRVQARVRFLSVEPMLEEMKLPWDTGGLHWIICGGESGHGARPLLLSWAEDLRDQCMHRGIAFFMKQGSQANWPKFKDFDSFPPSIRIRQFPEAA